MLQTKTQTSTNAKDTHTNTLITSDQHDNQVNNEFNSSNNSQQKHDNADFVNDFETTTPIDVDVANAIANTINDDVEMTSICSSNNANASDDVSAAEAAEFFVEEYEVNCNEETHTVKRKLIGALIESEKNEENSGSMRIAFGIILRLVVPLANGVVRGIKGIRDVKFLTVIKSIVASRQSFTNLVAFAANNISMNLSAVQVSHHIEPILKLMKIRKTNLENIPDTPTDATATPNASEFDSGNSSDCSSLPITPTITSATYLPFFRETNGFAKKSSSLNSKNSSKSKKNSSASTSTETAPKCCTLNVLAEPPAGQPIRADIIFIHGLHGSLVNTWKQGLWENERRPVEFERPPKPVVRPPKRPRYTRSTTIKPPHRRKRARFTTHADAFLNSSTDREMTHEEMDENENRSINRFIDFSYICDEPKEIQFFEGIEFSFPTFRLRLNDNGRLIAADIDIGDNVNVNNNTNAKVNKFDEKNSIPTATATTTTTTTTTTKSQRHISSPDDPNYSKCWPGDWLPLDCPGVRVIAVNYTTDQYLWRPLWKNKEPRTNLTQRAREMEELLIEQRVGYGHPIIWVGHSKGGLFVKQIIVDAWESGRPAMAPFWRSSRGCFFYSVPHRGSNLASIKAPLLTRSVELIDIEKNSKYLLDLHKRFAGLYHLGHLKIEVFSFVETALTLMSVLYLRIVGADSADPGIGDVCGIRLDHREICKPRSRECILYKKLVQMINKVC